MAIALRPSADGQRAKELDRAAERELLKEVQEELDRMLGERQLLRPGPQEEARVRAAIAECVERHDNAAVTTGAPVLVDAPGVQRRLFDRLLRLGILQSLLDDCEVEEICVNAPNRVFCFRDGQKQFLKDVSFDDDEEVRQLVKRLVGSVNRRIDESSPMVDARLPDGSRLNAAIPPATTRYTTLTIRKFILRANSLDQLVKLGTLTESAATFLDRAVQAGVNILTSGATGSGKTTLLNCLGASIASPSERVITIEEVPELSLERQLPDCVALQARGANQEGVGEIRIRDLVRNALRMRPSRILVGECRGPEALDMLTAMNSGHDGSLTTVHGNSPRDALSRIITLAMMAEERLSREALARMVSSTIEVVIQLQFDPRTNRRRIETIFEVTGMEGDVICGNDLWTSDGPGGRLRWTGIQPRCLRKMEAKGVAYALPAMPAEGV